MGWDLVIETILMFIPLLWTVRQIHEGLQQLFFVLSGDKVIAIYLFQILLLPGVALHELSHYLTAKLLGVRVRSVSLSPKMQKGKIQMGAVAMDKPDFLRGVLIGIAPLVFGSVIVVLIGNYVFDVDEAIRASNTDGISALIEAIRAAFAVNDAWIWLYLVFAISTAMLPSEADRESLWPAVIFVFAILTIAAFAGLGPTLVSGLARTVENALGVLVVAFGITLFVDLLFLIIIWLIRALAGRFSDRRVERKAS